VHSQELREAAMSWTILQADAREIPLKDKSVQCVVTSPPYWGLRDYATNGQIGLEKTPEEYVEKIVVVFREVWRVLRDDGIVFLNLGDSYAGSWKNQGRKDERGTQRPINGPMIQSFDGQPAPESNAGIVPPGLKPKDLVGIPWRIAFALQAAGWYLRSDIIWSKPNPMPESVTDRPTKAHEYIFLLSKKERYFFDQDAVREETGNEMSWDEYNERTAPGTTWVSGGLTRYAGANKHDGGHAHPNGRNIRTVWEIATQPYPEAHFATFPEEIAERCIKAGTSEKGCCVQCGKAWERVWEHGKITSTGGGPGREASGQCFVINRGDCNVGYFTAREHITLDWQPACECDEVKMTLKHWEKLSFDERCHYWTEKDRKELPRSRPCIVLDPFAGAGTTVLVADKLNRRGIGLELKAEYCEMAHHRCFEDAPLLTLMGNS
jgi:DNA modification methylase